MAGSSAPGETSDNPVAINVTAMVDIIFCLCLFFMCSLHFKELEGKVDTWLPKEKGPDPSRPRDIVLEEVRIFMRWDPEARATVRNVGSRTPSGNDARLMEEVLAMAADYRSLGKPQVPLIIDSTPDVPWHEVVHVMDLCKGKNLERIELTGPLSQ